MRTKKGQEPPISRWAPWAGSRDEGSLCGPTGIQCWTRTEENHILHLALTGIIVRFPTSHLYKVKILVSALSTLWNNYED